MPVKYSVAESFVYGVEYLFFILSDFKLDNYVWEVCGELEAQVNEILYPVPRMDG
jgi:hypothetical protein